MKRLIPVAIAISISLVTFSNILIPASWSDSPTLTPASVQYLPRVRRVVPTPTPIPPINPTPPAEIPEYFDPLQVLPPALGGDWVEVKRCGDECFDHEDDPYTWEYSVASVTFENPNADRSGPAPYHVAFMILIANDIQGAKNEMDIRRADLTLPNIARCGRELTGLPAFGMDSFGSVGRSFHPVTLECWPVDKYPIPYYLRFRIANVLVLTYGYAYNDDEIPRVAYLLHHARIIEQLVRDKLVYN